MKQSKLKNSIVYLFLVIFLSAKITGLHAFFHNDNDDTDVTNCMVCDHITTHNLIPALPNTIQDFKVEIEEFFYFKPTH